MDFIEQDRTPGKRPFQTADWLALGLRRLAKAGTEAVKLAPICAAAGLTRGSFYYHFTDHNAFLIGMAEEWIDAQTRDVAAILKTLRDPERDGPIPDDLRLAADYRLDRGMRALGRRYAPVADVVWRADNMRLSVLTDLCAARYDLEREAAWDAALLEHAAFAGLSMVAPDLEPAREEALQSRYHQIVGHFFAKGN